MGGGASSLELREGIVAEEWCPAYIPSGDPWQSNRKAYADFIARASKL